MVGRYNIGKIIAIETGGKTVSFNSPFNFILPNTDIEMKISCKRFVNACDKNNNRGIIPDYVIENTINDNMIGNE